MADDLSKMSRKQLEKLLKDVQKALKTLETREKREAKKAAEEAAAKFGFKLSELTRGESAGGKGSSSKAPLSPPKYANPADPSQTWTGKGRQPNWYRAEVEKGTDPASMEIS
jgi:DNA-binding protein H-NS